MTRLSFGQATPLPDGSLTPSDGLPDGSDFCKCLQTRKVDGLTGSSLFSVGYSPYWHGLFVTAGVNLGAPPVAALLRLCCGFVAGPTSMSTRIYRYVADVAALAGGKGGAHISMLFRGQPSPPIATTHLTDLTRLTI